MKAVLFVCSVLALLGGVLSFGREYDVAYFSRSQSFAMVEELSSADALIRLPLSARGMRELFAVCGTVQQGIMYGLQPLAVRQVIDGKCLDLSQQVLMKNPSYSAAHTIKMMSSTMPQDIRAAMVLSQQTSAYESWDAKLRLSKSLAIVGTGDAAFDAALRADIIFLVQTGGGRTWLAKLYGQFPSARAFLTQTIDARPAIEKADFVEKVRANG
jgi:hypothetical protein